MFAKIEKNYLQQFLFIDFALIIIMKQDIGPLQTINITLETKTGLVYHIDVLPQTSIYQIKKQASILLNKKFIYFDLSYHHQTQTVLTKYLNELPDYKKATFQIIEKSNQQLYKSEIRETCLNFRSSTISVNINWKNDPYQIQLHENCDISDLKNKICSILDINENCKIMIGDQQIDQHDKIIDHVFNPDIRLECEDDLDNNQFTEKARLVQSIASSDKCKEDDLEGFQNRIKHLPNITGSGKFGSLKKVQSSYSPVDILVKSLDKSSRQLKVSSPNVPGKKYNLLELEEQARQCVSLASSTIQIDQQPRQIMIIFQNEQDTREYTISCSKDISIRQVFKKIAALQKTTVQQLLFYLLQEEEPQTKIQKLQLVKVSSRENIKQKNTISQDEKNQKKQSRRKSISQAQTSKVKQLFGQKKIYVIKMQFLRLPRIDQRLSQHWSMSQNQSFVGPDCLQNDGTKETSNERHSENNDNRSQNFENNQTSKQKYQQKNTETNQTHQKTNSDNLHIGEQKTQKTFQDLKRHLKQLETGKNYVSSESVVSSQQLLKKLSKLSNKKLNLKSQIQKTKQQQEDFNES